MVAIRRITMAMVLLVGCVSLAAWIVAPTQSRALVASVSHAVNR